MHEKRKAATVIINMCKLVLNASDVEPFVSRLLPELKRSAEDAAFEEIRGVCALAEQVSRTLVENSPRIVGHLFHLAPSSRHQRPCALISNSKECCDVPYSLSSDLAPIDG
jgi:hypothetical protein